MLYLDLYAHGDTNCVNFLWFIFFYIIGKGFFAFFKCLFKKCYCIFSPPWGLKHTITCTILQYMVISGFGHTLSSLGPLAAVTTSWRWNGAPQHFFTN